MTWEKGRDKKENEKQTESVLLNNIITNLGEEQQKKRYYLVRSLF